MVADTRSFHPGWTPFALTAGVSGTITPPVPLNVDAGELFIHNITQGIILAAIYTLDANGLGILVNVDTTGWLVTDRYCQVMSLTSTNHANLPTALAAVVGTDNIVMGTPNMEDPAVLIINTKFIQINFENDDVTIKSFSPIVKMIGVSIQLRTLISTGVVIEDVIFNQGLPLTVSTHTITIRRCAMLDAGVAGSLGAHLIIGSSADPGTTILSESCFILGGDFQAVFNQTTNGIMTMRFCLNVGGQISFRVQSTDVYNGCVAIPVTTGWLGTPDAASNHNLSTDGTAPGANSLNNRAVDDAKLIIYEDPAALPDNAVLPFMAYFPKSTSEWKGAAATIAGMDRRDFFGYLRPTTGVQTMGPINLEGTNGGVPFPGYLPALLIQRIVGVNVSIRKLVEL